MLPGYKVSALLLTSQRHRMKRAAICSEQHTKRNKCAVGPAVEEWKQYSERPRDKRRGQKNTAKTVTWLLHKAV
jgi:hypothetical protein